MLNELENLSNQYTKFLADPENADLLQCLENIKIMISDLEKLENRARTLSNPNDAFLVQECAAKINLELVELNEDLANAKKFNWKQLERQVFVNYSQLEIEQIQLLMNLWSPGTYSSVSESIIDHAQRKGYDNNILEYLQKSAEFDKKKAVRIPYTGFRDDGTVRWENKQTGEYLIEDNLGKICTYGIN